jgi:Na+-transporting NADH:ubiquinone oxidoreductase subunit NqrC
MNVQPAQGMQISSLLFLIGPILSLAFFAFIIISIIIVVLNSQKNRKSMDRIEYLLREISFKLEKNNQE